jgi:predicted phosphoadenosine phosphosulfate sulfurtransferase
MGLNPNAQRVAPPYGEEPMQRLYTYQLGWPELWAKMSVRVPGANTAAKYSRTELYNFGKTEKPEGATWKEMIGVYLLRWGDKERPEIARKIKTFIGYHDRKTNGAPIPDEKEHPDSGVSWKYLAMIASRGDLKGRRAPTLTPTKGKNAAGKNAIPTKTPQTATVTA